MALLVFGLAVIAYQSYVTALLARSGALTGVQLSVQCLLIWLVPMVGAVICHWFFKLHGTNDPPHEKGYRNDNPYNAIENGPASDLIP